MIYVIFAIAIILNAVANIYLLSRLPTPISCDNFFIDTQALPLYAFCIPCISKHVLIKKSNENNRKIIYIPVIHTQQDMGDLSESIHQAAIELQGKQSLNKKEQMVNQIWTIIEQVIDTLDLPFEKVKLYQDGLPVCGHELDIISDLADSGSRNHLLLLQLIHKGATLMGTESAELLLEEYRLIKQTISDVNSTTGIEKHNQSENSDILLKRRDQFIAQRINNTLGPDETGIIFLGMLHNLEGLVHNDIEIIYPITKHLLKKGINNEPET